MRRRQRARVGQCSVPKNNCGFPEKGGSSASDLREEIAAYFPEPDAPTRRMVACMFTTSPDEHFILDRHPAMDDVFIARRVLRTQTTSSAAQSGGSWRTSAWGRRGSGGLMGLG